MEKCTLDKLIRVKLLYIFEVSLLLCFFRGVFVCVFGFCLVLVFCLFVRSFTNKYVVRPLILIIAIF